MKYIPITKEVWKKIRNIKKENPEIRTYSDLINDLILVYEKVTNEVE